MTKWVLFLFLALSTQGAVADAVASLQQRLAPLGELQGGFSQTLYSAAGEPLESSSGSFRFLRPGYFYWHIEQPEEQLLVSADNILWHYDIELETATRRRLAADTPGNPLTILGGDVASLQAHYLITAQGDTGWRFEPVFEGAEFVAVELYFDGGMPGRLIIEDKLSRRSEILFTDLLGDQNLNPGDFLFTPPPGVDVYDSES